ncbi:MAG: thioredoxin family protein [Vicinamibacterales bacterium]
MTHRVEFFYSEHCVGCPEARQVVRQLAADRTDVAVTELDVAHHLGEANRYGLIATPAVVIDGGPALYGIPRMADLAGRLDRPPE